MKEFLFSAVLVAAAYKFSLNSFPFLSTPGTLDKGDKPLVLVFLGPNCGGPCNAVQGLLKERGISYQSTDVVGSDGPPNGYALTYVGYRRFSGYAEREILAAITQLKKSRHGRPV